ncbi:importin subunit beta-3 [Heterostelium album PN500]|uniref:Importin subunit beta-3 n=1 Tax=Heterostelium pallidum (strain ATCC 26659 / Pp 5 / PN500) TaxID=670386 RepID=D3B7N8_HETP5|nr:importin subunit beta-3 [Heterostelium album PN500]EFA82781.1 importin subunit beta-3 [Heterostelium album PN500]|eukprot:XP_020434898.1 importin subunit beta-3 [Heterostelium album PN500]
MDQIPQTFIDTIKALTHNDTNVIREAEAKFNTYKAQPDQLIGCLLFMMVNSTDLLLKEFSAVLVRPLLSPGDKNSLWEKISVSTQESVKVQLIELLKADISKTSRSKVVNIIASLSPTLISAGKWDLIPFLVEAAKSPVEQLRESAYLIVSKIVGEIAPIIKPHAVLFADLLKFGLNDNSVLVQTASLSAVSSFINIQEIDTTPFKPLLPLMITAITRAIEMNHEKNAQEAIVVFVIIAETKPNWFATNVDLVFRSFYDILISEMVEEETRHYALEFFMTLAQKRPSIFKKNPAYLDSIVNVLYKWTSEVDEIPLDKWNKSTEDGDDDNTNSSTAIDAFDRLASELPRQLTEITFSKYIPQLLKSQLWTERFSALMSIAMICEGAKKVISPNLQQVLQLIVPLVNDPVPRVRWCLFFCLGQMATDFGEELKKYYEDIFRVVGAGAGDQNPRVQGAVCLLLSTFLEDFEKKLIVPHINGLFTLIGSMLNSQYIYVAENALSAFSSIVECIDDDFKPYFDKFMAFLLDILQHKTTKPYRTLRGRAIEAISLIGLAVKKEVFAPHLHEIMKFISAQPPFESDDPQIDFFLRACTRFCQCLEKDFKPYVDYCMKPILNAIKADVEIVTTAYGDDYAEDSVADSSTIAVENKSLALSLLVIYTSVLGEELFAYVEPLTKELLSLIDYQFNEDIRANAVELIPYLFKVAEAHAKSSPNGVTEFNQKLFEIVIAKLSESVIAETLPEIISEKLKAIGEIVEMVGSKYMQPAQINGVFITIGKVLEVLDEYRNEAGYDEDEDDDDPSGNYEMQFIEDAYNSAAIAVGDVLISTKQNSVKHLQQTLLPDILERINDTDITSESVRSSMICIIDDLIEHGGNEAGQLYTHIIPPLIKLCFESKDAPVKHAAAFGLGAAAQYATQFFVPFIFDSLKAMHTCVYSPQQKATDEQRSASDNAISGIGRILAYCSQPLAPHMATVVPTWIACLPIEDDSESPIVVENLITVIKTNPSAITPNEYPNILKVFIIAQQKSYINADKVQDAKNIIISMKPYVDSVYAQLSGDDKKALELLCK